MSTQRGDAWRAAVPVEIFTMTRGEFDEWKRSLGTIAEIVASTGVVVYGG